FGSWLPLRVAICLRHAVTNCKEQLQVFDRAREVPIRPDLSRDLMIILRVPLKQLPQGITGWLADDLQAGRSIESRYACLGECVAIGSIEASCLRQKVGPDRPHLRAASLSTSSSELQP